MSINETKRELSPIRKALVDGIRNDPEAISGPPAPGTMGWLILAHLTDPVSSFHHLRFAVRVRQGQMMKRMFDKYAHVPLSEVRAKTLLEWYADWSDNKKKISAGHGLASQLRGLTRFGILVLESAECERIAVVLHKMRFPLARPRTQRLTFEQAEAICKMAHEFGRPSIALAQAIQFECTLRQKDVIGEIVPLDEPGVGLPWRDQKWMRGLLWSEIDDKLVLRHVTAKTEKPAEFDLKLAPLVMRELSYMATVNPGKKWGPIIKCETTGLPWIAGEYRRHWREIARAAGVPDKVLNMDSRAGGISEAFEAEANADQIRQTATHSQLSTTQIYNRSNQLQSSANVMTKRVEKRNRRDL